jgi:hypothetical protein
MTPPHSRVTRRPIDAYSVLLGTPTKALGGLIQTLIVGRDITGQSAFT